MSGKRRSSDAKNQASKAAADKERLWVDQWAKELRGQKEWSRRWGSLNDPKMFFDGSDEVAKRAVARKYQPTKWSGFSVINPPGKHPLPITAPELPSGLTPPTFKITGERHCQSSRPPKNSGLSPAYLAPYAMATPVPLEDVQKLQASHRATISVCNLSLVGSRAGCKVEFARDPQAVYKYPATTSMEYGWNWKSKKTLDIYG